MQAVTISDLPHDELARRLRKTGIALQIGCFTVHLQSSIAYVAEGIGLLYAHYPLAGQGSFADFHVRLVLPRNLRRWYRPQVLFLFDNLVPFKPLPLEQAFPMFEWGLNWCVHNHVHRFLILHAAVIERDGFAAIMAAPPGSGKSTLCAGLVARGWRLLSDEMALISMQDGMLTPLPRPVSLKNESIEIIRRFAPGVIIGRQAKDTAKGTIAHMKVPDQSVVLCREVAKPTWLIFPRYRQKTSLRWQPLSKGQSFMRAAGNSFNYNRLGHAGFHGMGELIDRCDCFEFTYGSLDEAAEFFDSLEPPSS